jgi:predicted N-acetyltransferase YhbS
VPFLSILPFCHYPPLVPVPLTKAELSSLAVSPENQRRGIGSQLLEAFLEETDAQGLQAVLGASKEGRGLYERYGFVTSEVMTLKMWEYEGGSGMGIEEHVIMHRPAV